MADITSRVRFIGDANQLLATYKAIGAQAELLQRQINRVNAAQFKQLGLKQVSPIVGLGGAKLADIGSGIKNVKTDIDAVNKTFRVFGDTVIRTKKYGDIVTGTFSEVRGSTDELTKGMQRYARVENFVRTRSIQTLRAERKAIWDNSRTQLQALQVQKDVYQKQAATGRTATGQFASVSAANQQIAAIDSVTAAIKRQTTASIQALRTNTNFKVNRLLDNAGNRLYESALTAPPPIPADIQQLSKISPTLLKQLQNSGLGRGDSTYAKNLYSQGAKASFERNLVTGVTQVSGSFEGANGVVQRFNAEIDKSGKLITRFGGQLSGVQNFLNQTVRNFQKVVQWGIATTAVFGSIAFAARELGVLTELNTNLTRLGITANLSKEQVNSLFNDLANVGIATATPLTEITASADDIALAVRETGKSTQDYMQDIINLTSAVGIYTNLTGTDTVQATDLLTSAMKQLGLQTEDVTGLLSKITAVAGGQSTAIADITEGLAAMAEAARNAGLSVDRTIATVQILSQVTAKTPSEIATSFKNLVGALENPAGIKQLKALNISLVSEGNNIIDIYKEIAEKIRTGVIGATEVSGILRNLAGGPRRAPDAAALLSNIDKIAASEARAIRASNEALIANAKILDTVQKRVVQLQARFDKLVFQKLGPAFEQSIEGLLDALTNLVDFLSKLDTSFVSTLIQIGLFFGAFKLGVSVVKLFGGVLNGLLLPITKVGQAFAAAAVETKAFNVAQQQTAGRAAYTAIGLANPVGGAGVAGGRFAGLGGRLGGVAGLKAGGIGAGVGAVAGAAFGGGDIKSVISGGLSGLGLGLLTIPEPTGLTKLAGGIALVGSVLVNLIPQAEDASKALENNAEAASKLLGIYSKFDEANHTIEDLQKQQDNLRQTLNTLNQEQNKSPEVLAQIDDAQKQYIDNALEMSNANVELRKSMEEIRKINPQLANAINASLTGSLRPEELEKQIRDLQLTILRATDPNALLPNDVGIVTPNPNAPITPYQNPTGLEGRGSPTPGTIANVVTQQLVTRGGRAPTFETTYDPFNLDKLQTDADKVKTLFNKTGTELTAAFAPTGENIGLVSKAIADLKAKNDSLAPSLEKTFNEWIVQNSAIDGAVVALNSYQNRIDALKFFNPQQAAEFQKVLDLGKQLIELSIQTNDAATIGKTESLLSDFLTGKQQVNKDTLLPILKGLAQKTQLTGETQYQVSGGLVVNDVTAGIDALKVYDEILKKANLDFTFLGENGVKALQNITEESIAAAAAFDEYVQSTTASLAEKSASLQAQFQAGDFKGNEEGYRQQQAAIEEQIGSLAKINQAYQEAAATLGDKLTPNMQAMAEQLTGINGLQDATSLSAEELIQRMFGLADVYGLNGKQTEKLRDKIIDLINAVKNLSSIKAQFLIGANVDVSSALKKLRGLLATVRGMFGGGGDTSALENAIANLEAIQNIGGDIKSSYSGGVGSNLGSKSKGSKSGGSRSSTPKATKDISTLDLPEEIANAGNRNALIQEAIKRAKELQKQIPGASKDAKNDIVELLKGTQKILEVRGVKDELLRRALEELADIEKKRLEQETKADTIRRIRVGSGSFAAIANLPVNSITGASVGGPQGPINVTLNLNGTVLTPAQFSQFADQIAAALKRQIAG